MLRAQIQGLYGVYNIGMASPESSTPQRRPEGADIIPFKPRRSVGRKKVVGGRGVDQVAGQNATPSNAVSGIKPEISLDEAQYGHALLVQRREKARRALAADRAAFYAREEAERRAREAGPRQPVSTPTEVHYAGERSNVIVLEGLRKRADRAHEIDASKALAALQPHIEKMNDLSADFDRFTFDDKIPLGFITDCLERLHGAKARSEFGWVLSSVFASDVRVHITEGSETTCSVHLDEPAREKWIELTISRDSTVETIADAIDEVCRPIVEKTYINSTNLDEPDTPTTQVEINPRSQENSRAPRKSIPEIVNRILDQLFRKRAD